MTQAERDAMLLEPVITWSLAATRAEVTRQEKPVTHPHLVWDLVETPNPADTADR